jgi:hypothetical protein
MIRLSPRDHPACFSPHPKAHLMRYQTEIFVPADRYVCLQLPEYLPEGKAVVTILVEGPNEPDSDPGTGEDSDHHDIEWWEEFDDAASSQ